MRRPVVALLCLTLVVAACGGPTAPRASSDPERGAASPSAAARPVAGCDFEAFSTALQGTNMLAQPHFYRTEAGTGIEAWFVGPDRYHQITDMGVGQVSETIAIGADAWSKSPSEPWAPTGTAMSAAERAVTDQRTFWPSESFAKIVATSLGGGCMFKEGARIIVMTDARGRPVIRNPLGMASGAESIDYTTPPATITAPVHGVTDTTTPRPAAKPRPSPSAPSAATPKPGSTPCPKPAPKPTPQATPAPVVTPKPTPNPTPKPTPATVCTRAVLVAAVNGTNVWDQPHFYWAGATYEAWYVSPDRWHVVSGGANSYEVIMIGSQAWIRYGVGDWSPLASVVPPWKQPSTISISSADFAQMVVREETGGGCVFEKDGSVYARTDAAGRPVMVSTATGIMTCDYDREPASIEPPL